MNDFACIVASELIASSVFMSQNIPTLGQIEAAAYELPDPNTCEQSTFTVRIEAKRADVDVAFRRIRMRGKEGGTVKRWIYEGKVLIRSNLIKACSDEDE